MDEGAAQVGCFAGVVKGNEERKLTFAAPCELYRFDGHYVRISIFEGPLELLLYLVRRSEADICEIPLAEITRQFLEQLQLMKEVNIAVTSDFILTAATLLYLKSALLLPQPEVDDVQDDDGSQKLSSDEVKAMLTKRLNDYIGYREAAEYLQEQCERRALMFTRVNEDGAQVGQPEIVELGSISVFDLFWALREALSRLPDSSKLRIRRRKVTVAMRIKAILSKLRSKPYGCMFWELCEDCRTRLEVIVTFIALLELIKRKLIIAEQDRPFAPIIVHLAAA
ncbi:MAG: segregation/condensation protein A [Armatimonadota bacterium]|nr:segregation/condensation protein A [Armatimonadota bacterium]MCX7776569.1 segregation/condensation protein A [Armatimonadota bacterium]MDW8026097.1 segregation/condensation protein A [Armatimonadota bacterium]